MSVSELESDIREAKRLLRMARRPAVRQIFAGFIKDTTAKEVSLLRSTKPRSAVEETVRALRGSDGVRAEPAVQRDRPQRVVTKGTPAVRLHKVDDASEAEPARAVPGGDSVLPVKDPAAGGQVDEPRKIDTADTEIPVARLLKEDGKPASGGVGWQNAAEPVRVLRGGDSVPHKAVAEPVRVLRGGDDAPRRIAPGETTVPAAPTRLQRGASGAPETEAWVPIQNYSWDSGGTGPWVDVVVSVPGATVANVSCDFKVDSFDLKVRAARNYRLVRNSLDRDVVPAQCRTVVRSGRVTLKLRKKPADGKTDSYPPWDGLVKTGGKKERDLENAPRHEGSQYFDFVKAMYDSGDDKVRRTIGEAVERNRKRETDNDGKMTPFEELFKDTADPKKKGDPFGGLFNADDHPLRGFR